MELSTAIGILEKAKASIEDPSKPYNFRDWTQCTCGHVYKAASGRWATNPDTVAIPFTTSRGSRKYRELMKLVDQYIESSITGERSGPMKLSAKTAINTVSPIGDMPREGGVRAIDELIELMTEDLEPTGMDIGEEIRTIKVEPPTVPVPQREEQPARRQIPTREPDREPVREPEKVPAE